MQADGLQGGLDLLIRPLFQMGERLEHGVQLGAPAQPGAGAILLGHSLVGKHSLGQRLLLGVLEAGQESCRLGGGAAR